MTRTFPISALVLASAIAFSASSSAMAHGSGGGHGSAGAQHFGGAGGTAVAAKSVNLGGLGKFVLKNAIQGGKLVGGALGSLGGAMGASGKCPSGVCKGSPL